MRTRDSGGFPSTAKWSWACCASSTMRQLRVPSLKAAAEANMTCSSTSQTTTSPLSSDGARNLAGSQELDQMTIHSPTSVLHQLPSGTSSVSPVFSGPSEASTEVSLLSRAANQLIAKPIRLSLLLSN